MKKQMKEQTNQNLELVFVLDRSGSMGGLESDTIGGFNAMIEKQRKHSGGEVFVTTVLFDDRQELLHDRVPLAQLTPMTEEQYTVRGCTALYDAVGDTVAHIGKIHRYARSEDVPAHTMVVITTDGMENASRRYSSKDVRRLISKQKELGWEFLFIGANIDAGEVAESVGIGRERAANYSADASGTAAVFRALAEPIRALRANACIAEDWAEEIEADHRRKR